MWRPTGLDRVEMLMPFRCPLGPIFTNITEVDHLLADINSQPLNPQDRKQATLEIFPVAGTTKKEQCSKIDIRWWATQQLFHQCFVSSFQEKSCTGTIKQGTSIRNFKGSLRIDLDKENGDGSKTDRYIAYIQPANSPKPDPTEMCTIKIDVSKEGVVRNSRILSETIPLAGCSNWY